MKKLFLLFCLIVSLCGIGCVHVPYTTISGDLNAGTFTIKAPKDGEIEGLEILRGTNGTVQVRVAKHTVRMNPDVISQTAAGQAQFVKAVMEGTGAVAGQVTKAAVEGMKPGP